MSYFRENIEGLSGYVPGFQPSGEDVVKLNTNENPYPPSERVLEALRSLASESLRRYPQPLAGTFREAAGRVLGVPADHIIATNGGDDLLTICFRAFCDANRPVVYPGPTYSLYPVLAALQGCECIERPWDGANLPVGLSEMQAGLVIVCNPNAPTAHRVPVEAMRDLAGKLSGRCVLLIDEAYVDFARESCIELVRDFDNVILLRSMSKGYSLAGIRFGFGIARPSIIEQLMKVKDSYNVDVLAQTAATAAIADQEYFRANVERVIDQRRRLTESLRKMDFDIADSETNFVWARPKRAGAKEIYEALQQRRIYVRYWDRPPLSEYLRISVGTSEQIDKLLAVLDELLSKAGRA